MVESAKNFSSRARMLLVAAFLLSILLVVQAASAAKASVEKRTFVHTRKLQKSLSFVVKRRLLRHRQRQRRSAHYPHQITASSISPRSFSLGFWIHDGNSNDELFVDFGGNSNEKKHGDDSTLPLKQHVCRNRDNGDDDDDQTTASKEMPPSASSDVLSLRNSPILPSEAVVAAATITTRSDDGNIVAKKESRAIIDNTTTAVAAAATETLSATTTKRRLWKQRLCSLSSKISGAFILPGTPLFLRLLPVINPSEVISKIIHEIPPLQLEPLLPLVNDSDDEILTEEEKEEETMSQSSSGVKSTTLDLFAALPSSSYDSNQLILRPNNNKNGLIILKNEGENSSLNRENVAENDLESPSSSSSIVQEEKEMSGNTKFKFFRKQTPHVKKKKNTMQQGSTISKDEKQCPAIVTNIHELRDAVLINGTALKDVGFRFPIRGIGSDIVLKNIDDNITSTSSTAFSKMSSFQRFDPKVNGTLSSLLNCVAASSDRSKSDYQLGIDLINQHAVMRLIKERVRTNSTPGYRRRVHTSPDDNESSIPHLALVIEGGGMRGAVSAGMAAALSTLDLLDVFDSVHGSSAGAIVGAYIVSRQLCTDIYTDIMPAAGSKFASTRRGMINFGVDYLSDLIERKLLIDGAPPLLLPPSSDDEDEVCVQMENEYNTDNASDSSSAWFCDDGTSSVELAMGRIREKQPEPLFKKRWSDDHYDGLMLESMNFLLSGVNSFTRKTISKPISFGVRRFNRALRPALDALDFAAAMRQYLRRRPGMNLTYVLEGIMHDTHGLRPFDIDAFRANDKRQPLYVISSTVSNGGSGNMETIAFNSAEGDFFGLSDHSNRESESVEWYKWLWNVVKKAPFAIFSALRKTLFASDVEYESQLPPPGTNAMYGFVNRNKQKKIKQTQEEKIFSPTGRVDDEGKSGIYPCLEASALVPGAAGPPLQLIRSKNRKSVEEKGGFPRWRSRQELNRRKEQNSHLCFDAFCFEAIPYRSAVEKANATHVLALRSRPDGCIVETKQHMYERLVAPIYFRRNGMKNVAKWFASGGSQFRYIEDILTLEEGLARGIALGQNTTSSEDYLQGVKIPPTKILYGSDDVESVTEIDDWKRAHLLPIALPFGTSELPALSQDRDEVILAVRHGYAAAFDVLAPIAGLPFDSTTIRGERVAELLFPMGEDDVDILNKRVKIKSSYIGKKENEEEMKRRSFAEWITRKREAKRKDQEEMASNPGGLLARQAKWRYHESDQYLRDGSNTLEYIEIEALLAALPGFRGGRLDHISDNLKKGKGNSSTTL